MKKNNHQQQLDTTIHTLNNLLTNINLSAELLLKGTFGTLNAQQKRYLKTILSEGEKIKNVIKKLK